MSDTPTLTGQDIGQAERATRAVFDRFLAETGTTFDQWVTLNVLAAAESPVDGEEVLGQLTAGLRIPEPTARTAIDEVTSRGLVAATGDPVRLELLPEGTARVQAVRHGIASWECRTRRLYCPALTLAREGIDSRGGSEGAVGPPPR